MLPKDHRRNAMVSLADSRVEVKAIAFAVERSVSTVRRWIRRSQTTGELHDLPRSGRPALYSEQAKLRLVAFYCQTQPLPDCGRWSLRWAARHLEQDPQRVDASPSKSTLHRILKGNRLKPHQSRYFLHITDPDFFPKMEHLVALYANPPRHLFFFDECPGIQVLKRLTPDLQTDAMKRRLEEFEYIRNGTLDVFAFLRHANGKVVLECHADHTTETFLGVFRRHVDRFPKAEPLHYVMDNLSSHLGYPFCQLVAQLSGTECPAERELRTQAMRAQWLRRQDKRIVIHFTPYHGSWLNLVEIWFGIMGAKVLHESYGGPEQLKATLEAFEQEWNLLLAHPFRWTYDGKGLHEKAVNRFTVMLRRSATQMELRILTKLMMLMTNLLNDANYFSEIPEQSWRQLAASLSSQSENIVALIQREQGPKRKEKAQEAAAALAFALHERSLPIESLAM
jgi:transposase